MVARRDPSDLFNNVLFHGPASGDRDGNLIVGGALVTIFAAHPNIGSDTLEILAEGIKTAMNSGQEDPNP